MNKKSLILLAFLIFLGFVGITISTNGAIKTIDKANAIYNQR